MNSYTNGQEIAVREPGTALAGFDGAPAPAAVSEREAGAVAAVAREEAEIKAAVVVAKQCPRDEAAAFAKLTRAARRPSFADGARYSFKRGKARVEGPSVKMARELARCWGNIRYGLRIVSFDDDFVHVKGIATDLETNTYVEMEDKFRPLVQRRVNGDTKWVKADERDLRELINRRGAICVRNALLQLMPPDVVDEITQAVKDTQVKAAKGEIVQDREKAVRSVVVAFEDLGVTSPMLEAYLGHPLDAINGEELVDLRAVYSSIRDGNTKREDHFDLPGHATGRKPDLNQKLEEAAKRQNGEGQEDDGPPTEAQIARLQDLMAKASDAGVLSIEDAEGLELAIHDNNGPEVRKGIVDAQKLLARAESTAEGGAS